VPIGWPLDNLLSPRSQPWRWCSPEPHGPIDPFRPSLAQARHRARCTPPHGPAGADTDNPLSSAWSMRAGNLASVCQGKPPRMRKAAGLLTPVDGSRADNPAAPRNCRAHPLRRKQSQGIAFVTGGATARARAGRRAKSQIHPRNAHGPAGNPIRFQNGDGWFFPAASHGDPPSPRLRGSPTLLWAECFAGLDLLTKLK
jgi:hypothetical protein